jgi:GNAT superfamily N-acetyltransferase
MDADVRFVCRALAPAEYRELYRVVGEAHHWRDRRSWTDDEIRTHLASADIAVWTCEVRGAVVGYFELRREHDGSVEIAYFGLVPAFIGRGLGGAMLTAAAEHAWAFGANRVWLHTCTLDSPHALPNYLARGFEPFREERYVAQLAE